MELVRRFDCGDEAGVLDFEDLRVNPEVRDVRAVEAELEVVVGEGLGEGVIVGFAVKRFRATPASQRDSFDRLADEAAHESEFLLFA